MTGPRPTRRRWTFDEVEGLPQLQYQAADAAVADEEVAAAAEKEDRIAVRPRRAQRRL